MYVLMKQASSSSVSRALCWSSMARLPLYLFVTLAVSLATYNTITMVTKHFATVPASEKADLVNGRSSQAFFDPVIEMPQQRLKNAVTLNKKRLFHVAVTATDATYNRWQCRIMYYWYQQFKNTPGSEMGGFTRVLHSGKPDKLMSVIPTVVVHPLPHGEDRGYVVLNRPWAFVQWLRIAKIEEDYIMMAEPDHIFVRPLPNLSTEESPAAFFFFYINPTEHESVVHKFYPEEKGSVKNIDPIGNSPVIIKKSLLEKIAPTWMNISLEMKRDSETDKAFGWVLEMYGYAIASALHGVKHVLRKDFMIQPPWDLKVADAYMIHYTYGCDYTMKGILTYGKKGEWRFDKRSFLRSPPPRNLTLPPAGVPESVATLVKKVNEATANIPDWEGEW